MKHADGVKFRLKIQLYQKHLRLQMGFVYLGDDTRVKERAGFCCNGQF